MSPVQLAIVGCGRMGWHHAAHVQQDGRATITALFDPQRESATRLAEKFAPTAAVCLSLDELWSRTDVHGVILCTPTGQHFEQVGTAWRRGWHVLCEKPLATTEAEIRELMRLVEISSGERGDVSPPGDESRSRNHRGESPPPARQILAVAYQRRHASSFRTLRREIQSGRWGRVRAISLHCVEGWQATIHGTWRDDPRQNPGGFLGDAGSHKIDLVFYLTGLSPREVFARGWQRGSAVNIAASVTGVLGDDVPLTMDFIGDAQHLAETWHIHCERADLMLHNDRLSLAVDGCVSPLAADEPHSEPVFGFLDTILGDRANLAPVECALPVFTLTRAIFESTRSGQLVKL